MKMKKYAQILNYMLGTVLVFGGSMAYGQSRTYTLDADFDEGALLNVNHDVPDQLQLNQVAVTTFPFAWIANANEGTVSKVNTDTGREVGRYRTGRAPGATESPSRTTVDRNGNCWVANRAFDGSHQSSVTQILIDGGIDRNNNGTIETSQDLNNNGVIDAGELLPWGDDERVARHYVTGSDPNNDDIARAVTLDFNGFLWVGLWNGRRVLKLDPNLDPLVYTPLARLRPPELASINTSPHTGGGSTYGLALGPNGLLYLATLADRVVEIDPGAASGGTDPPRVLQSQIHGSTNYGIAVAGDGIVWLADINANRCIRWNPVLGAGGFSFGGGAASRGRGITVDFDGNIWMACDSANAVAKYAPTSPPTLIFNAAAGGATSPIGVGVAADGQIIAVGQSSNSWGKIAKDTGATIVTGGPQQVGSGPYTYSDFTGNLLQIVNPQGTWTVVYDTGAAGTSGCDISWTSSEPAGTSVGVEVRAADNVADLPAQVFVVVTNGGATGVTGQYVEIRVTFSRDSGVNDAPILYDLTIQCNEPPDCSGASASPSPLWPPNHQFVPIVILGVTDPDGDPIAITIDSIFQDESVIQPGGGAGNTAPDGNGVGTATANVRAERNGTPKTPGDGRVYHIGFTADDGNGGTCTGAVLVCVPHDQRPEASCVDGGALYDSTAP